MITKTTVSVSISKETGGGEELALSNLPKA